MKNFFASITIVATLLTACCTEKRDIKIACIGDSITEGMGIEWQSNNAYPALLDSILGEGYEVINFGRSATTMMLTGDFPYWSAKEFSNVLRYHADIIVLMLGTNDSKLFLWNAEKYASSYQLMIDTLKATSPNANIMLCLPAYVSHDRWEITDSVINNGVIPIVKQIANANKLPIIDINSALKNRDQLYCDDGIHPNKQGAKIIAETVAKKLRE